MEDCITLTSLKEFMSSNIYGIIVLKHVVPSVWNTLYFSPCFFISAPSLQPNSIHSSGLSLIYHIY